MTAPGVIMIVDDEVALIEMLRDYFLDQGYEVEVATNGGDALMLASLRRPDAVILDLKLPGCSGAEVFEQLRALDDSIAVVMLSGANDADQARALLKAGAFDFVRKPFRFDDLDGTVRLAVAVGMRKPRRGVVLPFRSDRRTASVADEPEVPRSTCGLCDQAIDEFVNAVMDAGRPYHAACWRGRRMQGS